MPYDPNQPRVPAGSSIGGEWTDDPVILAARRGAGLPVPPKIPEGASNFVILAYTSGLSQIAVGLTPEDMKMLRRGVRQGDLVYETNPSDWFRKKWWMPVWRIGE